MTCQSRDLATRFDVCFLTLSLCGTVAEVLESSREIHRCEKRAVNRFRGDAIQHDAEYCNHIFSIFVDCSEPGPLDSDGSGGLGADITEHALFGRVNT